MSRQVVTRRQKDISRMLRDKKKVYPAKLKSLQNILQKGTNVKKLFSIALLFLIGFCGTAVFAGQQQPWQLRVKKDGICVYTRKVNGSPVLEFKSDIVVSAPINKVIALFEDDKKVPQWYYQCKKMDLMGEEGSLQKIYYFVISLPWPVTQRDSVFRRSKSFDSDTGSITYSYTALPAKLPLQKGNVRVTYLKTLWRFTPLKGGQTQIYFQQHSDPGGFIPSFITNALVVDIPFKSLQNFRELLQK